MIYPNLHSVTPIYPIYSYLPYLLPFTTIYADLPRRYPDLPQFTRFTPIYSNSNQFTTNYRDLPNLTRMGKLIHIKLVWFTLIYLKLLWFTLIYPNLHSFTLKSLICPYLPYLFPFTTTFADLPQFTQNYPDSP